MRSCITIVATLLVLTGPAPAAIGGDGGFEGTWLTAGEPVESLGPAPDVFGTDDPITTWVSAEEFQYARDDSFFHTGDGFWTAVDPGTMPGVHRAPLHLPAGALIAGYTVVYEDSDASVGVSMRLEANTISFSTPGTTVIGPSFQSVGSPGVAMSYVDIVPDHTVAHQWGFTSQSYAFRATLSGHTSNTKLRGVVVLWYRQVSPAPASATFADVPVGYWAFQHVEALAASGITAGCGGGNFCPEQPLTRAQMAVFLAKALGLHYDH